MGGKGALFMDGSTAVDEAPFARLQGINTQAATSSDTSIENIKVTLTKNYPWLQKLPEFQKIKGNDKPIALIAGGPSIEHYVDDIKQFKTTIACGSANDWAMKNGIIPTYAIICDPDPVSINYYTKLDTETKYLISSACDPKIFDHVKDYQVITWHCHSEEIAEKIKKENLIAHEDYYAVSGGCTVGLRALSIALLFGYTNVHMFGYDSCLGIKDKHHAYDFTDEAESLGEIYNIKIGDELKPNSPTFRCAGYQLAQASNFREFYLHHHQLFNPTVYGNGLIAAMLEDMNNNIKAEMEKLSQ